QRLFAASNPGLFARYSTDGGQTWQASNISNLPSSCCDNQAAADEFGNLFVAYLASGGTVVAWSTNFGRTFAGSTTVIGGGSDPRSIAVGGSDTPGQLTVWVSAERGGQIVATGARVTGLGQISSWSPPQVAPGSGTGSDHGSFGGTAVGPHGE